MKTRISYHNIEKPAHARLEELTQDFAERRLGRHLSNFNEDLVQLHAHFDRRRQRAGYQVKLQLSMPGDTLASDEESENIARALEEAFVELERQLERHISQLRHDDTWRRNERRPVLRRLKMAIANRPKNEVDIFGKLLQSQLSALHRFVRRELAYLQAHGDLAQDYPTVDDMVDEVLARASRGLNPQRGGLELRHWLYQIALTVLGDEVRRRRAEAGRFISLESRVPIGADETVDKRDEARFEFWQPDEMLALADVIPVEDITPEDVVSAKEMRRCLAAILAELPTTWRRAVMLAQAEGLSLPAVARQLGISEDDVRRCIEHADAFLRARLREVGLEPSQPGLSPAYLVQAPSADVPALTDAFNEITDHGMSAAGRATGPGR